MRQRLRPRISKRSTVVLALATAAAFGAGLIAFPAGAAAAPPVVPNCTFPNTSDSDSCATLRVNAVTPPIGAQYENARLGFLWLSQFSPATSETTRVILRFDDDITLNLNGIPTCPATEVAGKTVAQAWEQCGPGADGAPASEGNAYLSTGLGNNVSGFANTTGSYQGFPEGFGACTMIFKGADNNHLTLYFRAPVGFPTECDNPATNSGGSNTVVLTGTLSRQPTSSPYDWTLTVPNTQVVSPALDDLYATVVRGPVFRARCPAGTSPHRMQGIWDYTAPAPSDPNDTFVAADPCP